MSTKNKLSLSETLEKLFDNGIIIPPTYLIDIYEKIYKGKPDKAGGNYYFHPDNVDQIIVVIKYNLARAMLKDEIYRLFKTPKIFWARLEELETLRGRKCVLDLLGSVNKIDKMDCPDNERNARKKVIMSHDLIGNFRDPDFKLRSAGGM